MRVLRILVIALVLGATAYAELENVEVGGTVDIRFRGIFNSFNTGRSTASPSPEIRAYSTWFPLRSMPYTFSATTGKWVPTGLQSALSWNKKSNSWQFAESAVSLGAKAKFTNDVSAMIELYEYYVWGQNFRSEYITGSDARGTDNINLLQAYVQADKIFGQPLTLRIGRQCMRFDDGFLISDYTTPTQRLSYDAVRATYVLLEDTTIDAFWAKLVENHPMEEDGDVDMYGIHITNKSIKNLEISPFWYWVRDGRAIHDVANPDPITKKLMNWEGVGDYNPSQLHILGLALKGKVATGEFGTADASVKVAYELGSAGSEGSRFKFVPLWGGTSAYGDPNAHWNNLGVDAEAGYTFETVPWKPRVAAGFIYFEGQDHRSVTFAEWLNPFRKSRASVSFNRLFSETNYNPVLQDNGDLSNFMQARATLTIKPWDPLTATFRIHNTWADKPFNWPVYIKAWGARIPVAPDLSFLTKESAKDMGLVLDTILRYAYTPDLVFMVYFGHMFTGKGAKDGNFMAQNGNAFNGGTARNNADYVFLKTTIKF